MPDKRRIITGPFAFVKGQYGKLHIPAVVADLAVNTIRRCCHHMLAVKVDAASSVPATLVLFEKQTNKLISCHVAFIFWLAFPFQGPFCPPFFVIYLPTVLSEYFAASSFSRRSKALNRRSRSSLGASGSYSPDRIYFPASPF